MPKYCNLKVKKFIKFNKLVVSRKTNLLLNHKELNKLKGCRHQKTIGFFYVMRPLEETVIQINDTHVQGIVSVYG